MTNPMGGMAATPEVPNAVLRYPYEPKFPTNLPYDDGEPMDSPWHRAQMNLLIDIIEYQWRDRKDFYCGGNMFVHFSEERARNRDFRGPDFFVTLGVDHDRERLYWAIWEENGKSPDVIVELLSPTTAQEDLTTKKDVYERTLKTTEYFCYDPDEERLLGWRLEGGAYQTIVGKDGRFWSDQLKMWLGLWEGEFQGHDGTWLRLFNDAGEFLITEAESARVEARRADTEAQRANTEAQRANAAEAELARLRQELEQMRNQQSKNGK